MKAVAELPGSILDVQRVHALKARDVWSKLDALFNDSSLPHSRLRKAKPSLLVIKVNPMVS